MTRIEKVKERIARALRRRKRRRKANRKAKRRYSRTQIALQKVRAYIAKKRKVLRRLKNPPAKAACRWALDQVGTTESPPYSNRGPEIDEWQKATLGSVGWAWCQAFVNYSLFKATGFQLHSAYTPQVVNWAREGQYGLKLVPVSERRPGDWCYFDFDGGVVDHVELYIGNGKTVGGNTSPGTAGSQSNGGGVFIRERGTSQLRYVVRPSYKS